MLHFTENPRSGGLSFSTNSSTSLAATGNPAVQLSTIGLQGADGAAGADGAPGGAPTSAQYIVAASDATLSAERVLTDTATVAWDFATASQGKANVPDAAITYAKFQNVAGLSIVGRSGNSSGVSAAITGTDGQVLRVSGTTLGFGTIVAAGLASDAVTTVKILDANVTYAKIQAVAGLSVFGRSANSSGVGADLTGVDKQILRVSGTTLGFGSIDLSSTTAVSNQLASASMPALTGAVASAGATLSTTATVDLVFVIGDNTNTITTGVKGYFPVDFGFTIVQWTLVADASGSIVVDIWSDTYANYPPTVADTITASAKPTITTATKGQSSSIGTWTAAGAVASGNVLGFNVDSITTCKQVTLTLKCTKTS